MQNDSFIYLNILNQARQHQGLHSSRLSYKYSLQLLSKSLIVCMWGLSFYEGFTIIVLVDALFCIIVSNPLEGSH